jgi:hypothetical protein
MGPKGLILLDWYATEAGQSGIDRVLRSISPMRGDRAKARRAAPGEAAKAAEANVAKKLSRRVLTKSMSPNSLHGFPSQMKAA